MKKIFITLAIPLLFFLGSCSAPDQQTSDIASVSADSAEKTDSFNAGQYDKIKLTYLEMALGHTGGWTKTRTEKAFGEPASEETVALYDVTADVLTYQRGDSILKITFAGSKDEDQAFIKEATNLTADSTTKDSIDPSEAEKITAGMSLGQVTDIAGYPRNRRQDRSVTEHWQDTWSYPLSDGRTLTVVMDNDMVASSSIQ